MQEKSNEQRVIESNGKALKRARILRELSRKELASKLGITNKAIEKIENGRDKLSNGRLEKILGALEINQTVFIKIKRGKPICVKPYDKNVFKNSDRRSYKKVITKEVKALKALRVLKKLSQDQASLICGYSRPTIGHIENGRIELRRDRILHIISSYGAKYSEFEKYLQGEEFRYEIIERCEEKLMNLTDEKLSLVRSILLNL